MKVQNRPVKFHQLLPFGFLAILFLAACSEPSKQVSIPPNIIEKKTMMSIMKDIQVAEARISVARKSNDSAQAVFQLLFTDILKKHKVDSSGFRKSFQYYSQNAALMEEMFQSITDSLNSKSPAKL